MDITWGTIKGMRLRNKLAFIYTLVFTITLAISFVTIYIFSEDYRKEEFYNRLHDRTVSTFKISVIVEQIDNNLLKLFDQNTINSLSDEKIVLYDSAGRFLYSSADSADVYHYNDILSRLNGENPEYEGSDGKYELLGLRFRAKGHTYYGIARAYDRFGKRKMNFLGGLLVITFVIVTCLIIVLSFVLSSLITKPLSHLAEDIDKISPYRLSDRVKVVDNNDEINFLATKFNELLHRLENTFKFQVHYINHLSHELRTPLAVMMANAERALSEKQYDEAMSSLEFQKTAIMELSNIITALLDISRTEQKLVDINSETIRIDEIVFECIDQINLVNNKVVFDLDISQIVDESELTVMGNSRMIKMVIINLMKNAVNYSAHERASIHISSSMGKVNIQFTNDGPLIAPEDREKLFHHSFRGKNSSSVKGFGMGLPLSQRIVIIHNGTLEYSVCKTNRNCFTLSLPTSVNETWRSAKDLTDSHIQ